MKKLLLITLIFLFLPCCKFTDSDGATKTLKQMGYTEIRTERGFFGCGKDDTTVTRFTAISPTKDKVSGVVCSGFFTGFSKGNTVRFD